MGSGSSKFDKIVLQAPKGGVKHFPVSENYVRNQVTELTIKSKLFSQKVSIFDNSDGKEVFVVHTWGAYKIFTPDEKFLGLSCIDKGLIFTKRFMRFEENDKTLVYATIDYHHQTLNVFLHTPHVESEKGIKTSDLQPDVVVKLYGNPDSFDVLCGDPKNHPYKIATCRNHKLQVAADVDLRFVVLLAIYSEHVFIQMDTQ